MNESKNTSINLWLDSEDAPELSEDFFLQGKKMMGDKEITDKEFKKAVSDNSLEYLDKQLINIPLSVDVLAYFKATGEDWKNQVDIALKEYVLTHQ